MTKLQEQVRHQRRRALVIATLGPAGLLLNVLVALSWFGAVNAALSLRAGATRQVLGWALLFTGLAALFTWLRAASLLHVARARPRVVPYFERHLGGRRDAFVLGGEIARAMNLLDARAAGLGLTELSAFGFACDYEEQQVHWRDAGLALPILDALRASGLEPALDAEIEVLARVLEEAHRAGVRVALVVRLGDDAMISPHEMQRHAGSFG